MSTDYSSASSSATGAPVRISAGTAIKIGFFGALGATLFSLIISLIGVVIFVILSVLGYSLGNLIPPR